MRATPVLLALAACSGARSGGAPTAQAVVAQTMAALDRGDAAAIHALRIPSAELRTYVTCRLGDHPDEGWKFLDQMATGEIDAAAGKLRGKAHDEQPTAGPLRHFGPGDRTDEECTASRAFDQQDFETSFFLEGESEQPFSLTVGHFDSGWRVVFLKFGRGFNN